MALYRLMFDHVGSIPFEVMVGCVTAKVYVCPHVPDEVVMHVIVKGEVFELI